MYEFISHSENDTIEFAKDFAEKLNKHSIIVLSGDLGSGKTKFTEGILKYFGLDDEISSPTFTIVNEYDAKDVKLFHFDLYRLENEGVKTITDELREYSTGRQLTFVEWAEFSQNEIPFDRIEINVTYDDDDNRCFEFTAVGDGMDKIIEGLEK